MSSGSNSLAISYFWNSDSTVIRLKGYITQGKSSMWETNKTNYEEKEK